MNVRFYRAVGDLQNLPRDGLPEVSFAGRSNVGKSSLINSLVGRKGLASTSSTPGKTRTINFYRVEEHLYLVDLPGYGFASVAKAMRENWRSLIEGYFRSSRSLRGVVLIADLRHEPTPLDRQMAEWLQSLSLPFVVAATKSDKLSTAALQRQLALHQQTFAALGAEEVLAYSAIDGRGRRELWRVITRWTGYRPD
ncbi:MAG: ribosome biogenesis GTP-binding protein YihA/YsxC [candidate division KSB1 bacterium]|nr:ribosome biogenesis GTP-binding protein YihA/YsxC [candidate division KSB1 bacterium]